MASEGLTPPLEIGPMGAGDLDEVAALERLCQPLAWSRNLFAAELENPDICFWRLARPPSRELAGYMGFWKAVDEAHITNLGVHPDWRRRGLGEALARATLAFARGMGLARATLEVRAGNQAAIALYRKLGFTAVALRRGYYPDSGEDALVMWLNDLRELG